MENAPNPFENANMSYGRPPQPSERDSPMEAAAKRSAIARWYQARRDAARLRRERRAQAKAEQSRKGETAFNVMGRWAVEQAVIRETDPIVRRRRRSYLMQRWRNFMQQTFRSF
jgi:hypothetical protein